VIGFVKESSMANAKSDSGSNRFFRGEVTRRWQQLTTSEIEECCGDQSKLIELLQARYGYAKTRAEKEIELFFGELQDRLRMAA
jgi:hypothetical protein